MNEKYPPIDFDRWHPACNGTRKMKWFVSYGPSGTRYYRSKTGALIRFGSREAAYRCACKLNSLFSFPRRGD